MVLAWCLLAGVCLVVACCALLDVCYALVAVSWSVFGVNDGWLFVVGWLVLVV